MKWDYSSMVRGMTRGAKPFDVERLFIVLVVGLGFLVAAVLAWEFFNYPTSHLVINSGPRSYLVDVLFSVFRDTLFIKASPLHSVGDNPILVMDVMNPSMVPYFFFVGVVILIASFIISGLVFIVPRPRLGVKALAATASLFNCVLPKSFAAYFA